MQGKVAIEGHIAPDQPADDRGQRREHPEQERQGARGLQVLGDQFGPGLRRCECHAGVEFVDGRDLGEGLAVYLYPGSEVTPADYYADGTATSLVQPVGSADIVYDSDTDTWGYAFHYVAPGDYTLAWTCAADDEHPREDDALQFQASAGVTVGEAESASVDF